VIISRTPLRIGLVGGSSDLEKYIRHHGRGCVVSFPINVYTYINFHRDKLGYNSYDKKYQISYSKHELVDNVDDIKNDIVREAFRHFNVSPCLLSMTGDVFANGSGLASSSSYMISVIKAILHSQGIKKSNYEICDIAMRLERAFNPLLGYQDTYGCGIGSLKRMDFEINKPPKITYMPVDLLNSFDIYIVFTGATRSSTNVLESVKITNDDSLLDIVDQMEKSLIEGDRHSFVNIIKEGWHLKKKTTDKILSNSRLKDMDVSFASDKKILCHKLCGAGNGGFFLLFYEKGNKPQTKYTYLKIGVDYYGAKIIY
tara:strand:- start:3168 stop:4109 length:942 start_codon:yes stop_codon:yes gene_type:complete